jgi:uncharacterized protein
MSSHELQRRSCLLSLLLVPAVALAHQATDPPAAALAWPDLVPSDWDPAKSLGVKDLSRVDPDDPKVRKVWDAAPVNLHLDGRSVKMLGYLVPLDESAASLSEFLPVAEWGACIHTPAPPANQVVHVKLEKRASGHHAMDPVWVVGMMRARRSTSDWAHSGYVLERAQVARYVHSKQ